MATSERQNSYCTAVVRGGYLVGESYWQGRNVTSQDITYSAAKSYSAVLVGLAEQQGLIKEDELATRYIPEWKGTPSGNITIKNLLSMDSGLVNGGFNACANPFSTKAQTQCCIDEGQKNPPGTVWDYNPDAVQTLDRVIERATGMKTIDFATESLAAPLGFRRTNFTRYDDGGMDMHGGIETNCRDMARVGYLMLRGGEWAGAQLLSAGFVDRASHASQPLNNGYGYLWWINAESQTNPMGGHMPGVPDDVYSAQGAEGQVIAVFPSHDLVVTRLGKNGSPAEILKAVFAAVQA